MTSLTPPAPGGDQKLRRRFQCELGRASPAGVLGQYLGWKLLRVLDLDEERNWDRLPGPIEVIVRQALGQLASS
ncbi:hypothetical protein AB0F96_10860 [Streptomyces sp. NPDC023998]|uniref:hypothetical protein n=1 Tax=Streptomyces sp. NPDC023998 TaxID=3154597 RepID=UPI0033E95405